MKPLTIFVPVDFSESSYKALQYACTLARALGGNITYCHVIDAHKVVESSNPVVVTWSIEKLNREAELKMQSLKELISEYGVSAVPVLKMGNVTTSISDMLTKYNPDVVILGRTDNKRDSLFHRLINDSKLPIIIVPDNFNPVIPENVVIASDLKQLPTNGFHSFFSVVKDTVSNVSLLTINPMSVNGEWQKWSDHLQGHGIIAKQEVREHRDVVSGILEFIKSGKVDLLCTIRRGRLFNWRPGLRISTKLAEQSKVPVLVL
jgi:nucleotide-binding universal stress UspA family protein